MGVGVIGVAIGESELDGLGDRMDRVGTVMAHGLQVESFEKLERFEQRGPLGPDAALVDGEAAVVDCEGFFDAGGVGGEVDVADQGAVFAGPGVDATGDRSAIEGVGDQADAARAVGLRGGGGAEAGPGWISAASRISSVRSRSACQGSGRWRGCGAAFSQERSPG